MLFLELLKTAWQSLRTNPRRSILTVFGIVIGIAAVITIISLGNGVKAKLLNELQATSSGKQTTSIDFYSNSGSSTKGFDQTDVEQIKGNFSNLAKVQVKNPQSHLSVNAQVGSAAENASVTLLKAKNQDLKLINGRNISNYDLSVQNPVALISRSLAKKQFENPQNALGTSVEINHVYYRIVGVFSASKYRYQTDYLLAQSVFYQHLTNNSGNTLKLTFNQGVNVSQETKKIVKFLKKNGSQRKNGNYSYYDLGKLLKSIAKVIDALTIFISAIAGISLFIAGIGVMNMMYTSVSERTQEIGIRLAVGAQPNTILLQFLLEAVMLTVSGGLLGFILGSGLAKAISLALPFKAVVTFNSFLLAFGVSAFVGIVFGILPAKQAANKNLIDILR